MLLFGTHCTSDFLSFNIGRAGQAGADSINMVEQSSILISNTSWCCLRITVHALECAAMFVGIPG